MPDTRSTPFALVALAALVAPGPAAAGPDLSRTMTEGGEAYHPDSRDPDVRYRIPVKVRLAPDDQRRRAIGLFKYNRPKPADDQSAGRLQGGYLRLGLEGETAAIGFRSPGLVWRGLSVKLADAVARSGDEYPTAPDGWADLPLTRDQLDTVWGDFETAPPALVRVRCGVVYAGEWPIPAAFRGDWRIDRAKAAGEFKAVAGKRSAIRAAEAERLIERCLAGGAITPSSKHPPRECKLALFAQVRADMLRYAVGVGELEGEVCCELVQATGSREVRMTEWVAGERALALAVDLSGEGGKKARVREEVSFNFDGTPRQQRFVFSVGTDLARLGVERVVVEARYKEVDDKAPAIKVLTLTPKKPVEEWSLQTRAPSEAVAEYRVFAFLCGVTEPLRSGFTRVSTGSFNFSVPRHETSIGDAVTAVVREKKPR